MRLVITGTSSGIGRALAEYLMLRGHPVWGIARSDQSEFLKQHPTAFRFSQADVSIWPKIEAAAREVSTAWGSLDGLVCCAGIQGAVGPALSLDPEKWSATVRANLDGTYFSLRAFFPLLQRSTQRAKMVCFSGGGSTKPRPFFSAYGVAKTGIVRLVETLSEELRGQPIDINAVSPGAIHTRMTEEITSLGPALVGEAEYQAASQQMARARQPAMEHALGLVEWLLSPASDGISGRLISAPWDPWPTLDRHAAKLAKSDIYTLRRITPEERGGFL